MSIVESPSGPHLTIEERDTPEETYIARAATFARARDEYDVRGTRNANLNVALFFGALVSVGVAAFGDLPIFFGVAALLFGGFIAAFARLGRLNRLRRRYHILWQINDEGPKRLRRQWSDLPLREPGAAPADHPYAADLDLTGHASLQHLLATTSTPAGQATLQQWLLSPASVATARERQTAVAELAPQIDLRDELALRGRLVSTSQDAYERFLTWAEATPWLLRQPWLIWLTRALPILTLAAAIAQLVHLTTAPIWLAFIVINGFLTWLYGRTVNGLLDQVSDRQSAFQPYADLFQLVETQRFEAPALRRVQDTLARDHLRASDQMQRLARIMQYGDVRLSMFFPVLQAVTLWNFHVLWFLERWQRAAGRYARDWLATLSEVEALSALATLAYDNPTWAFPELTESSGPDAVLTARNLGHPLLPPATCVGNDVTIGPPGTFLLVTGSNMSGKSTLLRAIGVNVVLAQAGAPVCASAMRLPPIELATSIRVQDSLEQGVSYFMAELRRLKSVVDDAERARAAGDRTLLFLLDEILHGTNTGERQIAARRIIRHLLHLGATGAVSTHDLTLAGTPELAALSTPVHFTEIFTRENGAPSMRFDYMLRPGIATSTNALKLMEIVGLTISDDET
ncbi:MAG: MutS-related protein [Ktedonobacterales bacterium]